MDRVHLYLGKTFKDGDTRRPKIYFYGCGATGRLAKLMESAIWRPFWRKVAKMNIPCLSTEMCEKLEDVLIGEMTGGDRALISSLEGLEDLQLIGELQLKDHGIQHGDVVFAVTEGGETSSVIGTVLAARKLYTDENDSRLKLYFVFNNPQEDLLHLERSRDVQEDHFISKIPIYTGPQAVTGSTRMQATTIETFILGIILEKSIEVFLQKILNNTEWIYVKETLGFSDETLDQSLKSFEELRQAALNSLGATKFESTLTDVTKMEVDTYKSSGKSVYYSELALLTVFTDCTERSPTFNLKPLDTVEEEESGHAHCWIKVLTSGLTGHDSWRTLLNRPFKGLEKSFYSKPFESEIDDPYLRVKALSSVERASNEEESKYNFSVPFWLKTRSPHEKEMKFLILLNGEDLSESVKRFLEDDDNGETIERSAVVLCQNLEDCRLETLKKVVPHVVPIRCQLFNKDPLCLRQQVCLKMALNAHSTTIMAALGKLVSNTMTNVTPSNLKLIGRATYLIQMHVNHALRPLSYTITYAEANAVLFDVMEDESKIPDSDVRRKKEGEVAIAIVRILETFRYSPLAQPKITNTDAKNILMDARHGLNTYLEQFSM